MTCSGVYNRDNVVVPWSVGYGRSPADSETWLGQPLECELGTPDHLSEPHFLL